MSSVNIGQVQNSQIKVPNLYKKLGISNSIAVKPPLPKGNTKIAVKSARRQTMFAPEMPESFKSFQRLNTCKLDNRKKSATLTEEELLVIANPETRCTSTPKSRFIYNWVQKLKEKENSGS